MVPRHDIAMQLNLLDIHAKPFLQWVGGKRRLVPQIQRQMPRDFNTYYEPFLGGGAVFFYYAPNIKNAILSDSNTELITTYTIVKERPHDLIDRLQELRQVFIKDEDYYFEVRSQHNLTDPVEIAGRMIFLNKTCFNALYSVNSFGEFNGSKGATAERHGGDLANVRICVPVDIMNASMALQRATLINGDFDDVVKPSEGDFIYADPPYDSTKIKYQKDGFDQTDQIRLRDAADRWKKAGANVMLSNSLTDNIVNLYSEYRIKELKIFYTINSMALEENGASDEALIMSYEEKG